jgi:catechol 2,3-dioxygenase-like lactoylglutathione lyase family enzyme
MGIRANSAYPTVAVSELERSRDFYGGTLGLAVISQRPEGDFYDAGGGSKLLVYPSGFAGTAQSTVMEFDVEDLRGTMAELREAGVVFEDYDFPGLKTEDGVAELPGLGLAAWFKDPDGNILALSQASA